MAGKVLKTTIALGGKVDPSLAKAFNSAKSDASKAANNINKSMGDGTRLAGRAMSKSLKSVAKLAVSAFGVFKAAGQFKDFAKESVEAAKSQIEVQTKLSTVLQNVKSIQTRGPNVAAEAAKAAKNLGNVADNLEKVGVIDGDVTMAGMQQLATYQLSDKEITKLSGGMTDLLAQQKGLNASQSDAVSAANMIGKAMTGNVGALSRVGISFTEAQKKAIQTGDATKRAATIAQVLKDNVGGVNKALGQTDQGQMVQAANTMDDIKKTVGGFLLPLMNQIVKGILPYANKGLDKLTGIFNVLGPKVSNLFSQGFQKLSNIMPGITKTVSGFIPIIVQMFSAWSDGSMQVMPVILSALQSLVPTIKSIIPMFIEIQKKTLPVTISLIKTIVPMIADIISQVVPLVASLMQALIPAFNSLIPPITNIIKTILPVAISLLKLIVPFIASLIGQIVPLVGTLINALLPAFQLLIPPIMSLVRQLLPVLKSLFSAVFNVIKALAPVISVVAQVLAAVLGAAIITLIPIIRGIVDHFTNIINVLSNIINFIVNVFTGNWSAAWQNVKNIFSGIFTDLLTIAKIPLNQVISLVNSAINGINGLTSVINKIPGVEIGKIPQIPYLAKGATVTSPTLAMIGEGKVPETVVPHNNTPRSRALLEEASRGVGIKSNSFSFLPLIDKIANDLSYFNDHMTNKIHHKANSNGMVNDNTSSGKIINQITYAPVVNVKDSKGVKEVLDDEFEKFKKFMTQWSNEQEREVFI